MSETPFTVAIACCILLMVVLYAVLEYKENLKGRIDPSHPWSQFYDSWTKRIVVPPGTAIGDAEMELLGKEEWGAVKLIDLGGHSQITDKGIAYLVGLTNLEFLDLSGTGISDDALLFLAKLPKLKRLNVSSTKITGATLGSLTSAHLRVIKFNGSSLTEQGLYNLKHATFLEEIDITDSQVTPSAVDRFRSMKLLPYTVIKRAGGYGSDNLRAIEERKLSQVDIPLEQRVPDEKVEVRCRLWASEDLDYVEGYRGGDDVLSNKPDNNGECFVIAEGVMTRALKFRPAKTAIELRKQAKLTDFPCTKELKDNLKKFTESPNCLVNSKSQKYKIGTYLHGKKAPCGCKY